MGFKLDSLPGNMIVVLAKIDKEKLLQSGICPDDYNINSDQNEWLVICPTGSYDQEFYSNLALNISSNLKCETIKYEHYDSTGHQELKLFKNDSVDLSYMYGEFDEEMLEFMGEQEIKENETVIREDDYEYIYYSVNSHPTHEEIKSGDKLFNKLFADQNAELSWDYLPK